MSVEIEINKQEKIKSNFESRGYETVNLISGECSGNSFKGVVSCRKNDKYYLFDYACVFNSAGNIIASGKTPKLGNVNSSLCNDELVNNKKR